MILIADSGSTKTSWCLTDKENHTEQFLTAGINPFYMDAEAIVIELKELNKQLHHTVNTVYFYGAGVASPDKADIIKQCCRNVFPAATVEASTDLLGAARALCGYTSGLVGILGTGSNSCFYNGQDIADTVPSCGFILGDEGSGAALGKHLIADFLKRRLPAEIHKAFRENYPLNKDEILEQVYRKPFPNRFLAAFTPFLHRHQNHDYVYNLLKKSFDRFFTRNILYYDYTRYPLHLLGSVSFYFQNIIREVAVARHIQLGKIEKNALPGLLHYHQKPIFNV